MGLKRNNVKLLKPPKGALKPVLFKEKEGKMQRVHVDYCNAVIGIVLKSAQSLWNLTVSEAIQKSTQYGKADTFRLDAIPEIHMRNEYASYDQNVVFVTEETGAQASQPYYTSDNRSKFPITDVSDPFDRSNPTQEFLRNITDSDKTLWELFADPETKVMWENNPKLGAPAEITGSCIAVTRVLQGVPIFSVIVNFVTRQLIVACSAGIYLLNLPEDLEKVNLSYIRDQGVRVYFPDIDHRTNASRFVTFMGKKGYKENFEDSDLMTRVEAKNNLHFDLPGGPLRPLYLSTIHPEHNRPGFILSNGEKLGEWVHWLTFLRYGKKPQDDGEIALKMHEIFGNRSNIKDGVLMSPTPPYSLFRSLNEREGGRDPNIFILDVGLFPRFPVPSRIRSTLVLAPSDNQWINNRLNYHGYRRIRLISE